jgi:hypothetical protein
LKVALNTIKQTNMHITFDRIIQGRRSWGWENYVPPFFWGAGVRVKVFNATFNSISVISW